MDKNKVYIMRDIDDEQVFAGNQEAVMEYAQYLNDDERDEEEKIEIKDINDAIEVIKRKRILVVELDIRYLNFMQWNIFKECM